MARYPWWRHRQNDESPNINYYIGGSITTSANTIQIVSAEDYNTSYISSDSVNLHSGMSMTDAINLLDHRISTLEQPADDNSHDPINALDILGWEGYSAYEIVDVLRPLLERRRNGEIQMAE